jgi:hypothetical protein
MDIQKVTWEKSGSEPADDYSFYQSNLETTDIPCSKSHNHFPLLVVPKDMSKTLCDTS